MAKLDLNSRPNKAGSPNKIRPGSEVSGPALKKWNRLKNATLDDEFPVDRDQEVAKSQRAIDQAKKLEAGRVKMATRPKMPRTDHPYLGGYNRRSK